MTRVRRWEAIRRDIRIASVILESQTTHVIGVIGRIEKQHVRGTIYDDLDDVSLLNV